MLIPSVSPADSESKESGKTVVFTTYHLPKSMNDSSGKAGESNWYPSMYFYDLEKNVVSWQIYGAEIFVNIDDQNNVLIVTNEIWNKLTSDSYSKKVKENPD